MEEVSVRRNTAVETDVNEKVTEEHGLNGTDAMMNVLPTPDNSIARDSEDSRPSDPVSTDPPDQPMTNSASSPPPSQPAKQPPLHPPQSPPTANQSTSPHLPSPLQKTTPSTPTKSAPATNPFYHSYRPTTPPIASSAEASPLVSPAKRFSSGEVKQPYIPTSPLNQLTDEDRAKFAQLATQLKTRLTYAAIKVENGWEKHSFSQIKSLLNEQSSPLSTPPGAQTGGGRRRSQTFNEGGSGKLTYETFWATHARQNAPYTNPSTPYPTQQNSTPNASQPSYPLPSQGTHSQPLPARGEQPPRYATFPRRKPERLSLQMDAAAHTARDQSAAEIMIALASPRTRSEFSSPERDEVASPSPKSRRKDVDGLGIHA